MDFKIAGLDALQKTLNDVEKAASPQENARRWATMRCQKHHQAPKNVRVVGNEATAEFCCESFRASALAASSAAIKRAIR